MVTSVYFVLLLTSNKRWDCYKYKPFNLGTTQLFSFLSQILSIEWRPKREKRNVTLLWPELYAHLQQNRLFWLAFHRLAICWKYLFWGFKNHLGRGSILITAVNCGRTKFMHWELLRYFWRRKKSPRKLLMLRIF